MKDSERYIAQADAVVQMASRAASAADREVYEAIADGWRRLAAEALRNEKHDERIRRMDPLRSALRSVGRL